MKFWEKKDRTWETYWKPWEHQKRNKCWPEHTWTLHHILPFWRPKPEKTNKLEQNKQNCWPIIFSHRSVPFACVFGFHLLICFGFLDVYWRFCPRICSHLQKEQKHNFYLTQLVTPYNHPSSSPVGVFSFYCLCFVSTWTHWFLYARWACHEFTHGL